MTPRNPERTRAAVLEAAFGEIHARGYRAASLETILRRAGVTKGALYHHFPSKRALGYAVVEELMGGRIRQFGEQIARADDPLEALRGWLAGPPWLPVRLGCPVNNLAQEMAGADEGFRCRIDAVFADWRGAIATALAAGQARGRVRPDVDPARTADFVLAALEGAVSLAKSAGDERLFEQITRTLADYVAGLAPQAGGPPARRDVVKAGPARAGRSGASKGKRGDRRRT